MLENCMTLLSFVQFVIGNTSAFQITLDVLLVFYGYWLGRFLLRKQPTNKDLAKMVDKLEMDIAEVRSYVKTSIIDIHDYVDGTLTPLHKRLVTRARREKESEASEKKNTDPFDDIRKLKGSGELGIS